MSDPRKNTRRFLRTHRTDNDSASRHEIQHCLSHDTPWPEADSTPHPDTARLAQALQAATELETALLGLVSGSSPWLAELALSQLETTQQTKQRLQRWRTLAETSPPAR